MSVIMISIKKVRGAEAPPVDQQQLSAIDKTKVQSRLSFNRLEKVPRNFVLHTMHAYRNPTGLSRMRELTMASASAWYFYPTIALKGTNNLSHCINTHVEITKRV
jgi:hypothetical protein